MALEGNLRDMNLSDVIQMGCRSKSQARLLVQSQDGQASIFFEGGQIVHANLGSRAGEEVIYELLTWEDGAFELEMGVPPPERTITVSWSSLLLEGMRRIDERAAGWDGLDELESTGQDFEITEEIETMATKKKADMLADVLSEGLAASADIESGAVIGTDGMVLSAIVTGKLSEDILGAQAAAFYGIAKRASTQLERGTPHQAVIQSDNGNIVVTAVDEHTVFVGTTPKDATLGMVFREARDIADKLGAIM